MVDVAGAGRSEATRGRRWGSELSAGPAVVFGPAGTVLSKEAVLLLQTHDLSASDEVSVVGLSGSSRFEFDASQVGINLLRTQATFHLRTLGAFQVRRRSGCGGASGSPSFMDAGSFTGGDAGTSTQPSCAAGFVCSNGHCRADPAGGGGGQATGCAMTCPSGTLCDPTQQVCVAQPTQCSTTADCPTNFACFAGVCALPSTPSCGMNSCAAGQYCIAGMCMVLVNDGGPSNPNACLDDLDCRPGLWCVSGLCRAVCTASAEVCNNIDDDCDGLIDEGCANPGDGGIVCGGFAGLQCPSSMTCVDDPADQCDPTDGGADCLGGCVGGDGGMDPDGGLDGGPAPDGGVDAGPAPDAGMSCGTSQDCAPGQACVANVCR